MNTFTRSYKLVKESFSVLKKDKEIILYPIISGVVSIILLGFLIAGVLSTSLFGKAGDLVMYPLLFIYYLASYFTIIFFNTGLITSFATA
jgi:hypothetical protein